MASCASCGHKLDDGITKCPGCGNSLSRPGVFMEVVGWVLTVISSIPLIIGGKTLEQQEYIPIVTGGAMLVLGVLLVIAGKSRSSGAENPVREQDAESAPGA